MNARFIERLFLVLLWFLQVSCLYLKLEGVHNYASRAIDTRKMILMVASYDDDETAINIARLISDEKFPLREDLKDIKYDKTLVRDMVNAYWKDLHLQRRMFHHSAVALSLELGKVVYELRDSFSPEILQLNIGWNSTEIGHMMVLLKDHPERWIAPADIQRIASDEAGEFVRQFYNYPDDETCNYGLYLIDQWYGWFDFQLSQSLFNEDDLHVKLMTNTSPVGVAINEIRNRTKESWNSYLFLKDYITEALSGSLPGIIMIWQAKLCMATIKSMDVNYSPFPGDPVSCVISEFLAFVDLSLVARWYLYIVVKTAKYMEIEFSDEQLRIILPKIIQLDAIPGLHYFPLSYWGGLQRYLEQVRKALFPSINKWTWPRRINDQERLLLAMPVNHKYIISGIPSTRYLAEPIWISGIECVDVDCWLEQVQSLLWRDISETADSILVRSSLQMPVESGSLKRFASMVSLFIVTSLIYQNKPVLTPKDIKDLYFTKESLIFKADFKALIFKRLLATEIFNIISKKVLLPDDHL